VTEWAKFWCLADDLVATSTVVLDRPRGSRHPRYPDVVYPLDYGYLTLTAGGDGSGIDVWVGSLGERQVSGAIVTLDGNKRDAEVKFLLGCTRAEAELALACHNQGAQAGMLMWRGVAESHVLPTGAKADSVGPR
jgi:inorganic pyrophosphatase